MRERFRQMAATLALGLAAGAGIVPLLGLGEDEPPDAEQSTTTATTVTQVQPTTSIVVVTLPPVEIEGLDPVITRLLASSGHAQRIERSTLEAELDPAVVRVLLEANSVLNVLEPDVGE